MQELIKNEELSRFKEKAEEVEIEEPAKFTVKKYICRFANLTAYRLPEDSKIHCADGRTLDGKAGEYYVCLDRVQEFVLPFEIFKKMFIIKTEDNE